MSAFVAMILSFDEDNNQYWSAITDAFLKYGLVSRVTRHLLSVLTSTSRDRAQLILREHLIRYSIALLMSGLKYRNESHAATASTIRRRSSVLFAIPARNRKPSPLDRDAERDSCKVPRARVCGYCCRQSRQGDRGLDRQEY